MSFNSKRKHQKRGSCFGCLRFIKCNNSSFITRRQDHIGYRLGQSSSEPCAGKGGRSAYANFLLHTVPPNLPKIIIPRTDLAEQNFTPHQIRGAGCHLAIPIVSGRSLCGWKSRMRRPGDHLSPIKLFDTSGTTSGSTPPATNLENPMSQRSH